MCRPLEGNDIGDQAMGIMQAVIKLGTDIGAVMPAEGFQHFSNKGFFIFFKKAAFGFGFFDKSNGACREDIALRQNVLRLSAQLFIGDKVEAQQRGENAERIVFQGCVINRAEGGGVNRNTGRAQIVIADREHAHDREDAAHHGKLGGGAKADCAMAFFRNTVERIGFGQAFMQMAVVGQNLGIHVGDEVHEGAIGRHFFPVHGRHGCRKSGANGIRRNEFLVFHCENFR